MPKLNRKARLGLYTLTVIAGVLSVLNVVFSLLGTAGVIVYVLSAFLLAAAVFYLIGDVRFIRAKVLRTVEAHAFTAHLHRDYGYRTLVFSIPGTGLVTGFAIFNGVIGISSRSFWYGSLALYYLLLSMMRWIILYHVWRGKKESQTELQKLQICRFCGILLSAMALALNISVALMVNAGSAKLYPGFLIYAAATYTFYKAIMSVVNMRRAKTSRNVYVSTLRYIGHADALVSILSLQAAMVAAFGAEHEIVAPVMNAITGLVVCGAVLALGMQIVVKSQKGIRSIREELR